MSEVKSPYATSDMSDKSDGDGNIGLSLSDPAPGMSDMSDEGSTSERSGPTCPTSRPSRRPENIEQNQVSPTCPTCPTLKGGEGGLGGAIITIFSLEAFGMCAPDTALKPFIEAEPVQREPEAPPHARRINVDAFEERAAIAEFDGALTRADAEALAAAEQGRTLGDYRAAEAAEVAHIAALAAVRDHFAATNDPTDPAAWG